MGLSQLVHREIPEAYFSLLGTVHCGGKAAEGEEPPQATHGNKDIMPWFSHPAW